MQTCAIYHESHREESIAGYPQPKATGGIFVREPSCNIYAPRANPANKDSKRCNDEDQPCGFLGLVWLSVTQLIGVARRTTMFGYGLYTTLGYGKDVVMSDGLRITVWNEGVHEKEDESVRNVYPNGMGDPIARYLEQQDGIASVHISELDHEGQGLTDDILNNTDVMTWWGHMEHEKVTDENAARVQQRVLDGMGLVVLHSGHMSKPFMRLMGTGCYLRWREIGERERIWVVDPAHPIADGLPEYIELDHEEMYGEHFDIPQPDQLVFVSWFQGGEVFRSGCCWHRSQGKVFYFRPGHETFPTYYNETILKVIYNGVKWVARTGLKEITRGNLDPLEEVKIRE